jgi:hypothetical protein
VDAVIGLYAEDAELDTSSVLFDMSPPVGREAIRTFLRDFEGLWADYGMTPVRDGDAVSSHHVLLETLVHGRGKASGAEVEYSVVQAFELYDDEITWGGIFPSREQALEAVALRG